MAKNGLFFRGSKKGQKWPFLGGPGAKMQKNGFFFIFDHNQRAKTRLKLKNVKKRVLWGVTHEFWPKKAVFLAISRWFALFFGNFRIPDFWDPQNFSKNGQKSRFFAIF